MDEAAERRRLMILRQIEERGIRDPALLEALRRVPRERFVPDACWHAATEDRPLPIGEGQTISQPYIVALMIAEAALAPGARVLEVGTGSGYAAAVLGEVARAVFTIERHPALAAAAAQRLAAQGCTNVAVRCGDGTLGWPEAAPFDAILVAAGGPVVPEPLKQQLAEGGRLVIPVGPDVSRQRLLTVTRRSGSFTVVAGAPVAFVPLLGAHGIAAGEAQP